MAEQSLVPHQDAFYRRGLVLGLTMAEIMVLILFCLLLALALSISELTEKLREQDEKLVALAVSQGDLQRIAIRLETNPKSDTLVADILQRIDRQRATNSRLAAEVAQNRPQSSQGAEIENVIRELVRRGFTSAQIEELATQAERNGDLVREISNLRGQNTQLSEQIRKAGRGNEFPSCWATPEGKTESIFEMTILPNGISVLDRALPHRAAEQALLPLSAVQYERELSLQDFRTQLRPLYLWSVEQKCRFYVIRNVSSAGVRADLINAVDAFFYPDSSLRLVNTK